VDNYIDQKVIVITGAGGGFGRLLAQKTGALGASVVCSDVDASALEATVKSIGDSGGNATGVIADVTSIEQMRSLAARAVDAYGRIDVMVNNAGTMPLAFFSDHERATEPWDRCIDINIKGVVHGISAVYDQMIAQGRGHVVNLSSIYGNFPVAGAAVYGATKAAVNTLSEALRVESQGKIKVTTIKPTGVPGTGLGDGIVNGEALAGILGQNATAFFGTASQPLEGEVADPDSIAYWAITPDELADNIVFAINQPWGISISELTVRASGENYVL
jgi:NADP-dependent 3-hydroxy acid dehydrogenase YdfG